MFKKGKLICLEGPDGAGKSTQIKMLKEKYPEAIFTREPGGTPRAEKIRETIFATPEASPREHFDMFWEAREDHIQNLILPSLRQGKIVVSDRFALSTYAYQLRGQLNTRDMDGLFWERYGRIVDTQIGIDNIHYIYLDMDVAASMKRLEIRNGEVTHFDTLPIEFHQRVRDGGHEFMQDVDGLNGHVCHIVDAGLAPDVVHREVVAIIEKVVAA